MESSTKELLNFPVCPIENKAVRDFLTQVYKDESFSVSLSPITWMHETGPLRMAVFLTAIEWLIGQGPLCFDYMIPQFPSADLAPLPIGDFPSAEERAAAITTLSTTLLKFETLNLQLTEAEEKDDALLKNALFYTNTTRKLIEFVSFMNNTGTLALPALLRSFLKENECNALQEKILAIAKPKDSNILSLSPQKKIKP